MLTVLIIAAISVFAFVPYLADGIIEFKKD
jgi:hypothetical protein